MKVSLENYQLIGAIIIAVIVLTANFLILKEYEKTRKINYKKIILAIISVGIILRTVYILYTPITERQHDMEPSVGHLAYIKTIYETGKLPKSNKWQFYQQPLHHIIAAGWLKINEIFGIDLSVAEEGIQIVTAIYSSMLMLITYSILKELNIKDCYKVIAMLIIAVHPTLIILSGSINNDMLLVMLTSCVLLYLIKWYKKSSMKNTIILAILTALVALTKISGTIIAIPILYIFINKLIKDYFEEKNIRVVKNYIFKFAIFGLISLGLGLSYSIRNMVLFNQGLFYVPDPGSALYCGDRSWLERLTIFSSEWKDIYCHPYQDCNIITYLIKCSLFGEFYIEENSSKILAILMLIVNIILIILSLVSLIKAMKKNKRNNSIILNMFIIFFVIELIMYMYGNISMPYGCTMDFRYIVPTILLGMIFIVTDLNDESKLYYKITNSVVILFTILSIIFELTYMSALTI